MLFRSPEMMRTSARPSALKQVQTELALTAVAKAEGLAVSEEEYDAEITKLAEQYKMPADQVKAIIPQEELKKDLAMRKASELVLSNAKEGKAKKAKKASKKEDAEEKPKRTRAKKAEEPEAE